MVDDHGLILLCSNTIFVVLFVLNHISYNLM
jgi:hypothetical protein